MRAVTFQAPREVRVEDRPPPELEARADAIVSVEASVICGSDLHIYNGRVKIEPGFTIGHEFVGTVLEAGDGVTRVKTGDRVLGCFHSACGTCFFCLRGAYHKCDHMRVFGHGALLGSLQGTQAEQALVPSADMTLRQVPDGISNDAALFAGDVMGTGYHAVVESGAKPGDSVAVLGLGPVGLCAVQVALAAGAGPGCSPSTRSSSDSRSRTASEPGRSISPSRAHARRSAGPRPSAGSTSRSTPSAIPTPSTPRSG